MAIFLAVFIGNAFFWKNPLLGGILLALFLLIGGLRLGAGLVPDEHPALRWWLGSFFLVSFIMVAGSAAYYLAKVTPEFSIALAILCWPLVLWLGSRRHPSLLRRWHDYLGQAPHRLPASVWLAFSIIIFCLFLGFRLLAGAATVNAVRSPWLGVPPAFFVAVFILFLLLFALLWYGRARALSWPAAGAVLFLFLSVAVLVFPLGYGFDSFLHQATEEHIAAFGSIAPKPFYYIGQYALVLFGHQAFHLPIDLLDRWLLPALAALWLPLAWYAAAAHLLRHRPAAAASLIGLFLIPLSAFIVTTPQGLANLWTLLIVLASLPHLVSSEKPGPLWLLLPAAACLLTHPLAGLPIFVYLFLLLSQPARFAPPWRIWARAASGLIVLLGSLLLPLSFLINSWRTTGTLGLNLSGFNLAALRQLVAWPEQLVGRFQPLLDLVYIYGGIALLLLALIAVLGWWQNRRGTGALLRPLLALPLIVGVNYLLLSTVVDFTFLIDYERQNYAARLIPLFFYFLVPPFILGLGSLLIRLKEKPVVLQAFFLALAASCATCALYLTYPRDDAYERSHGFNVSQTDIQAVYAVAEAAAGAPYLVLANQSVSAAAVRSLGFQAYWGDVFFYPIPTGGELYELFLNMNDQPDPQLAAAAAAVAAAACPSCPAPQIVFYVVNDYWWQAPRIVETAKNTTPQWFAIDGGRIHVFRYEVE